MPFHWSQVAEVSPKYLTLEQCGEKRFRLVNGFCYDVPADASPHIPDAVRKIDVPAGFATDLASVPWPFWWLVASYGSHTRAAIVHDALVGDDAIITVERRDADYILLAALEEPSEFSKKQGSYIRHQLTWGAVCLFGTMLCRAKWLLALFLLMVAAFWVALIGWVTDWHPWWPFDRYGWMPAAALGLAGFLWKLNPCAHRRVAGRLWPIGVIGLPAIAPALGLVLLTSGLVWVADLLPAFIRGASGGDWELPPFKPTRIPL